jgi:hypothetical protein
MSKVSLVMKEEKGKFKIFLKLFFRQNFEENIFKLLEETFTKLRIQCEENN